MLPPPVGGHPAIDFLNTSFAPDGQVIEAIGDGKAYLDWLVSAGLLPPAAARVAQRFDRESMDTAAAEARTVREWARHWLVRWRGNPQGDYSDEIDVLNNLLSRQLYSRQVTTSRGELKFTEIPRIGSARELISLVAVQLAELVSAEQPSRVKDCAGPACTLWFLDRSKAHRRVFCSPAACGNRAKVAAFRSRQRG